MTNDRDPEVAPTKDELRRRRGCLPIVFWIFVGIVIFLVFSAAINYTQTRPVSVDNPVGALRFDELSSALVADPDREIERIVGQVWRFEGPKRTGKSHGGYYRFFWVWLDTNDGFDNFLSLDFVDNADESRFETEEVPIACLITGVDVEYFDPVIKLLGRRSIDADSCRVVGPDTRPATDSP